MNNKVTIYINTWRDIVNDDDFDKQDEFLAAWILLPPHHPGDPESDAVETFAESLIVLPLTELDNSPECNKLVHEFVNKWFQYAANNEFDFAYNHEVITDCGDRYTYIMPEPEEYSFSGTSPLGAVDTFDGYESYGDAMQGVARMKIKGYKNISNPKKVNYDQ